MQPDEYLGLHIRSGFSIKNAVSLINGQGIIDADYYNKRGKRGAHHVAVFNHGNCVVEVTKGMRIAQGIFYTYQTIDGDTAGKAVSGKVVLVRRESNKMEDMDLFSAASVAGSHRYEPLAQRMRPRNFQEFIGQQEAVGQGKYLRKMIEKDEIPSLILYGSPGTGKRHWHR